MANDDPFSGILKEVAQPLRSGLAQAQRVVHDVTAPILREIAETLRPPPPAAPMPPPPPPILLERPQSARLFVDDGGVGLGQISNLVPPGPMGEVERYLQEKGEAAQTESDEFRQQVALKDNEVDELNDEAPFMRQNPPSAIRAMLGNAVQVKSNTTGANAPMVARWQGKDIDCTNVTICLGVGQPPSGSNAAQKLRPFAIISVGGAGNLQQFEVDVGLGCQFTVAGSAVLVQAGMDDDGGNNTGLATISANINFRNVNHNVPITRTRYSAIGDSSNKVVQVPPYAKRVYFLTDKTAATYTLDFLDWSGVVVYTVAIAANSIMTTPITLAGDVEQVKITPQAGQGTVNTRLVFELAV